MTFTTERLTVRNLRPDDWQAVKEIWKDFDRSEYAQYDMPHRTEDQDVKKLVEVLSLCDDFYIVLLSKTAIGLIEIHDTSGGYEIGYCFHSDYHRKGYAKESLSALIDHHTHHEKTRFIAGTAVKITPSVKLLQSLGFKQIGEEQMCFHKDENGNDIYFTGGLFELIK